MKARFLVLVVVFYGVIGAVTAQTIEFVPPPPEVCEVRATNFNNGYNDGRGMFFIMLSDVTINSAGLFDDQTGVDLFLEIAETSITSGRVIIGQTVLAVGNMNVTTNGLEWIDFAIEPVTLLAGHSYHMDFTHSGLSNQNFFCSQLQSPNFTQGAFSVINGTQAGVTGNGFIPAMRVMTIPTPEPLTLDIKPGSDPNSINCNDDTLVIPVAILTTADFDATTVDQSTVTFETASPQDGHFEDVDGDGDTDLMFHFALGDTNLACESAQGTLSGQTFGGETIAGTDSVDMVRGPGGNFILFAYGGIVTELVDDNNVLDSSIFVGQSFFGSYLFDQTTPGNPLTDEVGRYDWLNLSVNGFTADFSIGNYTFGFSRIEPTGDGAVFVMNSSTTDQYVANGSLIQNSGPLFPLPGGNPQGQWIINLTNETDLSVITGTALPIVPPDINLFESNIFFFRNNTAEIVIIGSLTVLERITSLTEPLTLNIKPGSDPNSINCNNDQGVIPVAILTTQDFDATTVDHTTVSFKGASETHVNRRSGEPRRHEEDADGDGDTDLVFHFRMGETVLDCSSTEGILTGEAFDGTPIELTDSVRMVGGTTVITVGQPIPKGRKK